MVSQKAVRRVALCLVGCGSICLIGGPVFFFVVKDNIGTWIDDVMIGGFVESDARSIVFQCDDLDWAVDFYYEELPAANISCHNFPIVFNVPPHRVEDKCDSYTTLQDSHPKLRLKSTLVFKKTGPNSTICPPGDYTA